jgi:hypothetical protein
MPSDHPCHPFPPTKLLTTSTRSNSSPPPLYELLFESLSSPPTPAAAAATPSIPNTFTTPDSTPKTTSVSPQHCTATQPTQRPAETNLSLSPPPLNNHCGASVESSANGNKTAEMKKPSMAPRNELVRWRDCWDFRCSLRGVGYVLLLESSLPSSLGFVRRFVKVLPRGRPMKEKDFQRR